MDSIPTTADPIFKLIPNLESTNKIWINYSHNVLGCCANKLHRTVHGHKATERVYSFERQTQYDKMQLQCIYTSPIWCMLVLCV